MGFTAATTTDEKRVARGEHLLLARRLLRERDAVHHSPWRVAILAGGSPAAEIVAIRHLMQRASITAIDRNPSCCEAAREAGADEVIHGDLCEWTPSGQFDLIDLDFCNNVTSTIRDAARSSTRWLTSRGILMMTFSYGRDVTEVFEGYVVKIRRDSERSRSENDKRYSRSTPEKLEACLKSLSDAGVPDHLAARLIWIMRTRVPEIVSVILYAGAAMPMCSILIQKGADRGLSFAKLGDDDFERLILHDYPDPSLLYDCPTDRIAAIRRSMAARKAVATRQQRIAINV